MKNPTFLLTLLAAVSLLAGCTGSSAPAPASGPGTPSTQPAQTRTYDVFTSTIDFNETTVGLPHDTFAPNAIFAHPGDTVLVRFHNVEDVDEPHTFTMGAPFNVDQVVDQGHEANITLTPTAPGIYTYSCKFHQPTMTGTLVVV